MSKGQFAETVLAQILAEPLLKDFVHLRPYYFKYNIAIELCDLLVEQEPIVIPIQLKVQGANRTPEASLRWAQKQIKKASRQIEGSIRRLSLSDIKSDHPIRGEVSYPMGLLNTVHGIVVVEYNGIPFQVDASLPSRRNNIPIHYFSHIDFINLCQQLMTLPDLIHYLDARGNIPRWARPQLNDEKNIYAYYLTNRGQFSADVQVTDFVNRWELLTTTYKEEFHQKLEEDRKSEIFREIIERVHTVDEEYKKYTPEYLQNNKMADVRQRVEITRRLNSLGRVHRREISKKLVEKCERAAKSDRGFNYFAYMDPENKSTYYVFLASRHNRTKRLEQLAGLCDCVLNMNDVDYVIGIATEQINNEGGRSFDYLLVDKSLKNANAEEIERCRKIFQNQKSERMYDFPSETRRIIYPYETE